MSLVIVSCAVADFVVSAWLAAVTLTVTGEGRSAGAVYRPAVVIVPVEPLPLGMPFTLQLTLVLVVFVTVAANACEFPSRTKLPVGVTETLMAGIGGGDGGATDTELPPPQPCSQVPALRTTRKHKAGKVLHTEFCRPFVRFAFAAFWVRGRMHGGMQAKGQRKEEASLS